jgi:catechol 2,3-dioxygenase-like lactoylglutathione lyase family enzyme
MVDVAKARLVPALLTADLERTRAFYAALGFNIESPDGDRLVAERDGVSLFFFNKPVGPETTPRLSGTLYVFHESVDALVKEWQGKVEFAWGPELMPYGLYEFGIVDPNGYYLSFAERRHS